MSALGHWLTLSSVRVMSAFTPNSGHSSVQVKCPLCANSGHRIGEPFGKKKRPKVRELL